MGFSLFGLFMQMDQQSEMPLAAEPVTSMEDETRKKPTSPKQERVQKVLQTLVLYVGFFSIVSFH